MVDDSCVCLISAVYGWWQLCMIDSWLWLTLLLHGWWQLCMIDSCLWLTLLLHGWWQLCTVDDMCVVDSHTRLMAAQWALSCFFTAMQRCVVTLADRPINSQFNHSRLVCTKPSRYNTRGWLICLNLLSVKYRRSRVWENFLSITVVIDFARNRVVSTLIIKRYW